MNGKHGRPPRRHRPETGFINVLVPWLFFFDSPTLPPEGEDAGAKDDAGDEDENPA